MSLESTTDTLSGDGPKTDGPRTTSAPCEVHRPSNHRPMPHLNHEHHIWPLGWGGPNTAENKVVICPTGHANIHVLLNEYNRLGGQPPWTFRQHFGQGERDLAKAGWTARVQTSLDEAMTAKDEGEDDPGID